MSGVTSHFLIAAKVHSTAQPGAISLAKTPWLGSSEAPGISEPTTIIFANWTQDQTAL